MLNELESEYENSNFIIENCLPTVLKNEEINEWKYSKKKVLRFFIHHVVWYFFSCYVILTFHIPMSPISFLYKSWYPLLFISIMSYESQNRDQKIKKNSI